jgi:hypothetical protein
MTGRRVRARSDGTAVAHSLLRTTPATGGSPARGSPLSKLVTAETVVPRSLDPIAKQRLEDDLYDLHGRIFRGVDKAAFVAYVIDSKAEHTWIQLYRDPDGALGGYMALHIYERELEGRPIAIIRGEMGTLREHRGSNLVAAFFADRVVRYVAANPRRTLYLLASFVHPSSYSQTVRYVEETVWPREGVETPAEIRGLMDTLGDSFGLDRVSADNALVRKVGWQTIDSRNDRAYWERCERPGVQFFLRENPGYEEGHGLLTIARLTPGVIARGLVRYALARSERSARKLAARTRAGVASLLPAPARAAVRAALA